MLRLLTCEFLASLGTGVIRLALPLYALELGATYVEIGLLGVSYSVPLIVLLIPVGRWMDRYGRKSFLILGLFSTACTFALFALTRSVWQVLVINSMWGVVAAPILIGQPAAVADLSRSENLGRAMGTYGTFWSAGFAAGPLLGGFLYTITGAIWTFLLASFVALVAAVVMLTAPLPKPTQTFERGTPKGLGPACFVGFMYSGMVAMLFTLFPAYTQSELGLSVGAIGLLLMLFTAIRMVFFIPMGSLSDRLGYRPMISLGLLGVSAASASIAAVEGFFRLAVAIGFLGTMTSAIYPAVMSMVSKIGGVQNRGYALGIYNAVVMLSWCVIPGVSGIAADMVGPTAPYVLCALIALLAAGLTPKILHKKKFKPSSEN